MRLEETKRILLNINEPNERIIKLFEGRPEVLELKQAKRERDAIKTAIKSLEAWDKVKKEMLSQSIIKTHTESYESGFSDGLERAFDIIQDIIEEYLGGND